MIVLIRINNLFPGSQLSLAKKYHLPLFLHSRAAHDDFVSILREEGFGEAGGQAVGGAGGVVHSFTGKKEEMEELVCFIFIILVKCRISKLICD